MQGSTTKKLLRSEAFGKFENVEQHDFREAFGATGMVLCYQRAGRCYPVVVTDRARFWSVDFTPRPRHRLATPPAPTR